MYRHQTSPFGRFEKHTLSKPGNNNCFSLVPAFGACLLDVQFGGISVLDGYQTPQELDINRWAKNTVLFPFPNRIKDGVYEWEGEVYQLPINDFQTNTALHGFGMDKPMEVSKVSIDENSASITCTYEDQGENPGYPFPFTFRIRFRIADDNSFETEIQFFNDYDRFIPVGLGWHPYFRLSEKIDDMLLQLPPCHMIGVDGQMIPTGKRYPFSDFRQLSRLGITVLDNCFALDQTDGKVEFTLRGEKGTLRFRQQSRANQFNFFQVFTPFHRNSIAIEPMTCNIDAFNNGEGLIVLEPLEGVTVRFGFSFT